jgi:benzylsuccinate CoA-transferase BbsE subunit
MVGSAAEAPLARVSVVDLTTSLGEYAGRMLADLGADVLRFDGGPAEQRQSPDRRAFMNAGKRIRHALPSGEELDEMLGQAQVLLTSEGPAALRTRGLDPNTVTDCHPGLIFVSISPFGLTGPYADRSASDLTLLAAGGLLALAGDPDREPIRAWGEQTAVICGVHAATATLIALHVLDTEGRGQVVDLSAQEAVAHSIENAAQVFDLEHTVRRRAGAGPLEAGTGLFECADGWIYLVGGLGGSPLAWDEIRQWLLDGGINDAELLADDRWHQPDWRRTPQACEQFRAIFEEFAAARTKSELFDSGQQRGISVAPVATPSDLLENPQLLARNYFRTIEVDGAQVTLPGPPYRFRTADVGPRSVQTDSPHQTDRKHPWALTLR